MKKDKIHIEVSIGDFEVELEVEVHIYFDGIGHYECHGYCGFDKGHEVADVQAINWDESLYTDEQNKLIDKELDEIVESEDFQETVNIRVFD